MLPVSPTFLAAIRSSHQIVTRARLITPGATGVDPPGRDLIVESGAVTLDAGADVRATLDLTVAAAWPQSTGTAELVPYGAEVIVSRGVVLGNGAVERCPLGAYRITSVEQGDAPAGVLRITALDRMSALVEARLIQPAQFPGFTTNGAVVAALVDDVAPNAVIEWDDPAVRDDYIGRTVICESERAAFLRDLVESLGKVMHYDYRGVLVITDPPDPSVPVWEVNAGAGGVLVSAGRSRTRDGVYNAVVASGEALDETPPPYAVAYDLDPTSVTYWLGPYGQVPRFFTSPLLTTYTAAAAAANSLLARVRGLPYAVDFSAVPNPALEPLDPVEVVYPPGEDRRMTRETHTVEQVNIPLTAEGAMTCTTRLQATSTGGTG